MMRTLIFIMLALLNYTFAEDKTAPEPMQMEPELETLNEVASPDDMMLIWPKIPPSGDPKEVKKAIESQRLLDKIKHGAVALNTKQTQKINEKKSELTKSNSKVRVIAGIPLANALTKISGEGYLPLIFINSPGDRLWHERVWFSYDTKMDSLKLLDQLAKTFGFSFRKDGAFFVLSSSFVSKRVYKPVSINAEKLSLITIFKSIFKSTGINGIVSEKLRDVLVTIQLNKVPAIQAIKAIVRANNLEHQIIGNVHVIYFNDNPGANIHERHEVIKIEKRLD